MTQCWIDFLTNHLLVFAARLVSFLILYSRALLPMAIVVFVHLSLHDMIDHKNYDSGIESAHLVAHDMGDSVLTEIISRLVMLWAYLFLFRFNFSLIICLSSPHKVLLSILYFFIVCNIVWPLICIYLECRYVYVPYSSTYLIPNIYTFKAWKRNVARIL